MVMAIKRHVFKRSRKANGKPHINSQVYIIPPCLKSDFANGFHHGDDAQINSQAFNSFQMAMSHAQIIQ